MLEPSDRNRRAKSINQKSLITTPKRPLKPKAANPVLEAVTTWFSALPPELLGTIHTTLQELLAAAPRRWVAYPPMVLLPSGSFSGPWSPILNLSFPSSHRDSLCAAIIASISKKEGKGSLTHLAINSGIPLHKHEDAENILRTPSGLVMLYGDFGPALSPDHVPGQQDFGDAFWVRTKQNGIAQTWAPRYTMFSRGNVKEKARLLDFHSPSQVEGRRRSKEQLKGDVAVDLYAGIGYFVFSYAALGMR
ncbi:tRNA wybutosine-synthesizing protein, partial [Lachnellula occidentalis]